MPAIAAWFLTGCTFDASGLPVQEMGEPDTDPVARADASPRCVAGCTDEGLRTCEPEERFTPCPLGCNRDARACRALIPSNGVGARHLEGVTGSLRITPGSTVTIDTDTGHIDADGHTTPWASEGTPDTGGIGLQHVDNTVAVLAVASLTVAPHATLRASGRRALIILSAGDAHIEGAVDVSARCLDGGGATHCGGPGGGRGATSTDILAAGCAPGGNGTGSSAHNVDETGGGGGGLGTDGAPGGNGGSQRGGPGGMVTNGQCPGPELEPLRGGSGGGAGGIGSRGGDGGGGGGAIQITSFTRIAIAGQVGDTPSGIRAAGGGGRGGEGSDGGGGGGSGGAILLEAPVIELHGAVLAANGGGGGGGGGNADALRGESGAFGGRQARGGGARNHQGGRGASAEGPARPGAGGGDDTGGGGGGGGIIRLNVPESGLRIDQSTILSPSYTRGDPASE